MPRNKSPRKKYRPRIMKVGQRPDVLATGDEMNILRENIGEVAEFLQDSLYYCPNTLLCEWDLVTDYNNSIEGDTKIEHLKLDRAKVMRDLEAVKRRRLWA